MRLNKNQLCIVVPSKQDPLLNQCTLSIKSHHHIVVSPSPLSNLNFQNRAQAMNHGARQCCESSYIMFLHADCALPLDWDNHVNKAMAKNIPWFVFKKTYDSDKTILKIQSLILNQLTQHFRLGIVGTNALTIRRDIFEKIHGFDDVVFLEDVLMVQKLKAIDQGLVLSANVHVSQRHYVKHPLWTCLKNAIIYVLALMKVPGFFLKRYY